MPEVSSGRRVDYLIAVLLALVTVIVSLGGALGLSAGPDPILTRELGAAWAWAIGVGTGMYWVPWVKEAIRDPRGDRDE